MRIVFSLAFLACLALLTALLLVSNPAALVGMEAFPVLPWGKFGIHLSAFVVFGFFAHATRWPRPLAWPMVVLLMAYGVATETLQHFVPGRTAQVPDAVENILGIVIASGVYWLASRMASRPEKINLAAALVRCRRRGARTRWANGRCRRGPRCGIMAAVKPSGRRSASAGA